MERPNLSKCTKKIAEYITSLERVNERLEKELKILMGKSKPTSVYQETRISSKNKIYLQERHPVYFTIKGTEISVYENEKGELYISSLNGHGIVVKPQASNTITAIPEEW